MNFQNKIKQIIVTLVISLSLCPLFGVETYSPDRKNRTTLNGDSFRMESKVSENWVLTFALSKASGVIHEVLFSPDSNSLAIITKSNAVRILSKQNDGSWTMFSLIYRSTLTPIIKFSKDSEILYFDDNTAWRRYKTQDGHNWGFATAGDQVDHL